MILKLDLMVFDAIKEYFTQVYHAISSNWLSLIILAITLLTVVMYLNIRHDEKVEQRLRVDPYYRHWYIKGLELDQFKIISKYGTRDCLLDERIKELRKYDKHGDKEPEVER